jgi:hypothetical protein
MTTPNNRYFIAAHIADCGLSDEESAELLSTKDAAFGELQGDYPPPPIQTDVTTPNSMDEILDYYDQHQPYNDITILGPQDDDQN